MNAERWMQNFHLSWSVVCLQALGARSHCLGCGAQSGLAHWSAEGVRVVDAPGTTYRLICRLLLCVLVARGLEASAWARVCSRKACSRAGVATHCGALQEVLESLSCEPSKTHLPGKATRQDTKDIPSWQLLVALCRCEFWSALHRRGSPGSHIFLALYCDWLWLGVACLQYLPVWCSHWTFHEFDCPPGRSGGVSNFSAGVDPFINIPG